ncbi:VOC family protein [Kangiella sediminilitoris]|uniref:Lactoylglutathione lyase family protein n=1 Tax=Kangiella sediminilitoris TaxID=1144748 RepID=A0A1B3BAV7_9GAMM|nr:VOC family protein [Kangiella sediminilitoris]AOE49929.1 Lactoylglutathione lyase family protein [Kangiella sediminilitoris]
MEIGQIAITVSNVDSALSFYRDALGLEFLFAPSDDLAFLQSGQTRIMLTSPQGAGQVGKNSILYFNAEDIESCYKDILSKGGSGERQPELAAKMPDHELWIGFLKDPDGNLVGLMEEKR